MPEYHDTIGAWIEDAYKDALHNLAIAVEVPAVHRAQGQFQAIKSLQEQFDKVFSAEEAAVEKQHKKTNKALTQESHVRTK